MDLYAVIFPVKTGFTLWRPLSWRGCDRDESGHRGGLKGSRCIAVGNGYSSVNFRHLNNLYFDVGNGDQIMLDSESLGRGHCLVNKGKNGFVCDNGALRDVFEDLSDGIARGVNIAFHQVLPSHTKHLGIQVVKVVVRNTE